MIVVCWGPHFALLLVETDASYQVPRIADSLALVLVAMSPVLSPALYAFRYDQISFECFESSFESKYVHLSLIRRISGFRLHGKQNYLDTGV